MKLYKSRFTLKKQPLYITLLALIFFISTSTGFDFYSHAVAYYFHDTLIYNADLLFGDVVLPRYWLLSYIYEISSRIGIPIGVISLFLIAYPVYSIVADFESKQKEGDFSSYSLIELSSFFLLLILSFFYSGASLASLWFVALLKTKRSIFLIGGLLHPIGIILFGIGSLLINYKIFTRYLILMFIIMSFFYICTYFSVFTSSTVLVPRFEIEFHNIIELFDFAVEKKGKEIVGAGIVAFLFVLSKGALIKRANILQDIKISKTYTNIILLLFTTMIVSYMSNKNSLLTSLRTVSYGEVIYIAWFDWGEKELIRKETPWSLNTKRYITN